MKRLSAVTSSEASLTMSRNSLLDAATAERLPALMTPVEPTVMPEGETKMRSPPILLSLTALTTPFTVMC